MLKEYKGESIPFLQFKVVLNRQFNMMACHDLYKMSCNKEDLWNTYINSFPEGTNPLFLTNTEYDCACCKRYIRDIGSTVAIVNNKIVTIWDVEIGGYYKEVAAAMSAFVKKQRITNRFFTSKPIKGGNSTIKVYENGDSITWNHYHSNVPAQHVLSPDDIGAKLNWSGTAAKVTRRGLEEFTEDAINTVIELIEQNSLYRGQEFLDNIVRFSKTFKKFHSAETKQAADIILWQNVQPIRNSVIGTLLIDLSKGEDLTIAVAKYEDKNAPSNYKRPTALISKAQINNAIKVIDENGFKDSLSRRYAVACDLSINDILYSSVSESKALSDTIDNVFDSMKQEAKITKKSFDKVETIHIDKFLSDVLPKAEKLEVLMEARHSNNLMSLIAPENEEAKSMFKWDNGFSWDYKGGLADSNIKQKVKAAGGSVTGALRFSLAWYNYDDLDLHLITPGKGHIYHGNRYDRHARLDVDMNVSATTREAVENITWPFKKDIQEGNYELYVRNYTPRETVDVGFAVEMEFDGEVTVFNYPKRVTENITVIKFSYSKKDGITIIDSIDHSGFAGKTEWGITSGQFQHVEFVLNSPNHWNGKATGNKHIFFLLKNCIRDGQARGFFNEFLDEKLTVHRKAFEVLGSKMMVPENDNQLSGLGFSSTVRNDIICKITGSFTRTVRITF